MLSSTRLSNQPSATASNGTPQGGPARILVVSSTFPSSIQPIHGVFVKERVKHVALLPQYDISVVSPTPYFPPLKSFKRWYAFSQLPRHEEVDGLSVFRPRYALPPKVGGFFHPQLMARSVGRGAAKFGGATSFQLIDAHFIYPDGVASAYLSQKFGLPLTITCRGEDILSMPDLPMCKKPIQFAIRQASRIVALSEEIKSKLIELGAQPSQVDLIPNGVNTSRFQPTDKTAALKQCGLPEDRLVLLSVGYRLERKGFHLLIDAASRLKEEFPSLLVVVVGGPARWGQDYTEEIQSTIERTHMQDHVLLAGSMSQEKLTPWYSAADFFALLTSREGSPNVLLEALSCGLPTIATPVGGIPEVLNDGRLGVLLEERSVACAAKGIRNALLKPWDRAVIREVMEKRDWRNTALQVDEVFQKVLTTQH